MKLLKSFIVAMLLLLVNTSVSAQCTFRNTAFKSGEFLTYNLYYNWKFVWVKAGTAGQDLHLALASIVTFSASFDSGHQTL